MNLNEKYQKQLTLQERFMIQDGLNHGESIASIARGLGKDITTISREVRKHRIGDEGFSASHNDCRYRLYCKKQSLCSECTKLKRCCACKIKNCRILCVDYRSDMCKNTLRSPHVCNGCNCIYECRKPHFYYRANVAYGAYKAIQKDSRSGIGFSRQEVYELDCLITPLLKQGQSIAHIYSSHKDEIPCCMKSLYNYIDQGLFTVRNIDLPKKVKYRERKKKSKNLLSIIAIEKTGV